MIEVHLKELVNEKMGEFLVRSAKLPSTHDLIRRGERVFLYAVPNIFLRVQIYLIKVSCQGRQEV